MAETGEGAPRLSVHAREVLRLMRMADAKPETGLRMGLLRNMWARHVPRATEEHLTTAVRELQAAGLVRQGAQDSVAPSAQALTLR